MIKPHGSDALDPRFVYDTERHHALMKEAESLPSLLLNSAAAANAVMLGAGDMKIPAGGSVTFRYRVILHSGDEKEGQIGARWDDYKNGR